MSIACFFCGSPDQRLALSLGQQPLANSYLKLEQLEEQEPAYPLDLYFCGECGLVHIEAVATSHDIFSDYAYFSSYSTSWLEHARQYVDQVVDRLRLGPESYVLEIASNDGYLLQNFVERGIPCTGIEPAANVAQASVEKGIDTLVAFWGADTARALVSDRGQADLIIGNNVLAHVPAINDFLAGVRLALTAQGTVTMEFPHLLCLVEGTQFDTIYHEHFSYFSLLVAQKMFAGHGMTVYDVEELPTHGGSLRIYARHAFDESRPVTEAVLNLIAREQALGLNTLPYLEQFARRVEHVRETLVAQLQALRAQGKRVAAYGAPAKGNTLLNFCGIGCDLIDYTVDRSPHKQGQFLPGSRIPIFAPELVEQDKPDYLLILPWNLREEIMGQMSHIRGWGAKFIVPIPEPHIFD